MAERLNKKLVAGLTVAGMLITTAAAIVMVMNLPQRDPGPAAETAARYAADGHYEQARQWYERAYRRSRSGTKTTPESNRYLVLMGDMSLAMGDARNALAAWRQVILNDPHHEEAQQKTAEFVLELAQMRAAAWSAVQVEAEKLLNINPRNFSGTHALGLALVNQRGVKEDNLKKGAEYLREAFNGDKSNCEYANSLAIHYAQENQLDKAAQVFDELMANLPQGAAQKAKAWRYRGRFYLIRRVTDQQALDRGQRENAPPSQLLELQQRIAHSDEESLRCLNEALKIAPGDADNLIALGEYWTVKQTGAGAEPQRSAERQEYLAKAEQYFTQAIQTDKDGYEAYLRLSRLHLGNRSFDKALQVLTTRHQRGIQREGYLGPRNKFYMSLVRNEMFRILMMQADQARQQSQDPKNPELERIMAQLQDLRDQQAADTGPDEAGVRFMDARIKILKGDRVAAIKDLERAKLQAGDNPELQQYLAQLYMQMGEFGSAEESLRTVLQAYPNNATAWALQAALLVEIGQYDGALEAGRQALQFDPQNRNALLAMGRAYEAQKNWEKVKEIQLALAGGRADTVQTKIQRATICRAQAESEEGRNTELLAEAEKLLEEVLAEDPGNLVALQQYAMMAQDPERPGEIDPKRAGDMQKLLKDQETLVRRRLAEASAATQPSQETIDRYERIVATLQRFAVLADPKSSREERAKRIEEIILRGDDPFVKAVQLYQLYSVMPDQSPDQAKRAMEQLKKAFELKPDQPGIVETLFSRALQAKDWATAEKCLAKAIELNMDRSGGYFYRGRLLATRTDGAGSFDKALQEFRAGLKEFPTYSQGWVLLGRALVQVKQYEEAARAFREAFRLNPTNGTAALGLATIAALRNDEAEKNTYLQVCGRLIPNHPWVKAELQALEDTRDPRKGIARREEIRKADPKDTTNLLRLAALYEKENQSDKARAIYEECRKREPKDFRVVQAYTEFLRNKKPPEPETASQVLKAFVDAIDQSNALQKATAQLLMASHLEVVNRQAGAQAPTTQAVDEAYLAAAKISEDSAIRLDIANYFLTNKRFEEAEKWYREALAKAGAEKDIEAQKTARQNIIETLIQMRNPARDADLKKEIDTFRQKHDDPYIFMAESEYHASAGRLDEALASINQFVERRPDNALGHFRRGDIFFQRSLWQQALDDYRTAKSLEPKGFNYLHRVRLGLCLENLGQTDLAIAELASVMADSPGHKEGLDELLRLYMKLARWQDAERLLTDRQKQEPDNPEWAMRLLNLYNLSGNAEDAIKVALAATSRAQYADDVVDDAMQVYLRFERYDDLLKFIDTKLPAAKRARPQVDVMAAAAHAGKGDRAKAIERYNRVLDATSGSIERFANVLADLKRRLGAQAAMQITQERLARKPDERPSQFALGALQKEAGQKDAFVEAIQKLLGALPKEDTVQIAADRYYLLQSLAIEKYQRGDFNGARKAYEDMLAIAPNSVLALNNLAYLLMEQFNDPQSALPHARRAANLVPFDPNVLDTVGWNHVLLGNYELGIAALRRAIGMDDRLPAVHYHAAEAFYRRAQTSATGKTADLQEAETECKRAHELIRAKGADTEGIFDRILALGEKLGLKLDPKLTPQ